MGNKRSLRVAAVCRYHNAPPDTQRGRGCDRRQEEAEQSAHAGKKRHKKGMVSIQDCSTVVVPTRPLTP